MELLVGFLKTFPLEMGVRVGKSTYAMGGRSKRTCACDGGRRVKFFAILVRTC